MENDLLLNNQDDRNVDFASDAVRHTAHAHTAHAHTAHAHSNENLTETGNIFVKISVRFTIQLQS